MQKLLTVLMLALALAPVAAAQETNETKPEAPDDAAWVDDCPPDMMCAAGAEPNQYGSDGCIDCSGPVRGPADGSCEYCRGNENPSTCMDGADANETCDPDVQYFGDPINSHAPAEAQSETTNAVPGASFALVALAVALAIFVVARR